MNDALRAYAAQHGITSATALRQAILRPTVVETPETVTTDKPAERLAFEQGAAQAIEALVALINPAVPAESRLAVAKGITIEGMAARVQSALAGAGAEDKLAILAAYTAVQTFLAAKADHGVTWPPAADFEQATITTTATTRTAGPSWWQANFTGQPEPTITAIREALT